MFCCRRCGLVAEGVWHFTPVCSPEYGQLKIAAWVRGREVGEVPQA